MGKNKKIANRILLRIIDVTIERDAFGLDFMEDEERPDELQEEWRRVIEEELDWMTSKPFFLPDAGDMLFDRATCEE